MRISSLISAGLFALMLAAAPNQAAADDVSDRNAAIQLCRAEVAAQAGLAVDEVRLDNVRTRPRAVRVELDVWKNGDLTNVRCEVTRGENLQIAAITPALTQQAAAN